MGYAKVLGIKFVAISVTVLSIYGIFNYVSLGSLMLVSLLTTIISFLIGDLVILRRFGNLVASIVDFFLSFGTLWVLSTLFVGGGLPMATGAVPILTTSLLAAFFIACVEPFVHEYMLYNFSEYHDILDKREPREVQTEFAEEPDVHDIRSDNDNNDGKKQ